MVTKTDGYLCSDGEFFELIEDAYQYEYGLVLQGARDKLRDVFKDDTTSIYLIIEEEKSVVDVIVEMRFHLKEVVDSAINVMTHDAWANFKRMISYEE